MSQIDKWSWALPRVFGPKTDSKAVLSRVAPVPKASGPDDDSKNYTVGTDPDRYASHSPVFWLVLALLITSVAECSAARGIAPSQRTLERANIAGLSGLWEGTAVNDCSFIQMERTRCHALVNIALTMTQRGSSITGFYTCRSGTMSCRNQNDRGDIRYGAVRQDRLSFRVTMPDGSSCIFGSTPQADKMTGSYICLQGAAFVERGRWEVERIY
jgi:hypothetical protein